MLGAIIGDIVGSTREWHNVKTEDFELLPQGSRFTDDTVMTLAVAKWLMDDPSHEADSLVCIRQDMGRRYPNAGYGGMFRKWLKSDNPQPYGSYGNVNVRDMGYWQGDDAYVFSYGYESGMYADGYCFFTVQFYVSAGSLGWGTDTFEPK